jgi:hypothetical protein
MGFKAGFACQPGLAAKNKEPDFRPALGGVGMRLRA